MKEAQQIKSEVLAAFNTAGKKAKGDLKINSLNLADMCVVLISYPDLQAAR